jgi:predicted membrane protein
VSQSIALELGAGLLLVAAIALLLRLRRRFGSWWAPAIGLAVFVAMFVVGVRHWADHQRPRRRTRRRPAHRATANTIRKTAKGRGVGFCSLDG